MAFKPHLLVKLQPSTLLTQPPYIPAIIPQKMAVQIWTYQAGSDTLATTEAAGYFYYFADWVNTLIYNNGQFLQVGDLIYCVCFDGNVWLQVTAIGDVITTQVAPIPAGSITGAEIAAGTITAANIAAGTLTTTQLSPSTIQYAKVPMTAGQFNGMYAAPFELILPPAAGYITDVKNFMLAQAYGTAAYAAGGAVSLQYGATAHAAGVQASNSIAAASITGMTASQEVGTYGLVGAGANTAQGIYISNATAAFTTGDGTWNVHIWYSQVLA
jgi:hypothetical protein